MLILPWIQHINCQIYIGSIIMNSCCNFLIVDAPLSSCIGQANADIFSGVPLPHLSRLYNSQRQLGVSKFTLIHMNEIFWNDVHISVVNATKFAPDSSVLRCITPLQYNSFICAVVVARDLMTYCGSKHFSNSRNPSPSIVLIGRPSRAMKDKYCGQY